MAADQAEIQRYIRHEPMGVSSNIGAWNYPLLIAGQCVVRGRARGQCSLIKHSSKTPLCAQAFEDAQGSGGSRRSGAGCRCRSRVTEAIIQHPGVDHVGFTGSVQGGREVNRSAAGRFIEVGLELGGKDPAYVCADAPFEFSVENCVDGAFYNAGQSCCAIERIYVEKAIYGDFVEAFAAKTREYRLGDPMDAATTIGPLASKSVPAFLEEQVEAAMAAGGRLVVSSADFDTPSHGWFYAPAVVADAPQDSSLMQGESFGTVIGILPVRGDDEAVRLMNDSAYGLTASIWTSDESRAVRIGEQIETGTFYMNRCDYLDPALPWCGVKDTGRGATLSRYGLQGLTRLKSMHLRVELP